jgi:DNA adenine methylase
MARPFLKWVGGKTQLLDELNERIPNHPKRLNYIEAFTGGGALFFSLYRNERIQSAVLNDANAELILCYREIKNNVKGVVAALNKLSREWYSREETNTITFKEMLDHTTKEDVKTRKGYYFFKRREWNETKVDHPLSLNKSEAVERVALTIFLNKTCFNTPYGFPKKPKICDEQNLHAVHASLKNVKLVHGGFEDLTIESNIDLVYFDPPYYPISETSFTAYDKSGFNDEKQIELADILNICHDKGVQFLLSNSNPLESPLNSNFLHDLYRGFDIYSVFANRMINSKGKERGPIKEILVSNIELLKKER